MIVTEVELHGQLRRPTCGTEVRVPAGARLRGRVDSQLAFLMLTGPLADEQGVEWLAEDLDRLAAGCRELAGADYNERPAGEASLPGWDAEAFHWATHDPGGALGIAQLTIWVRRPPLPHLLNLCRTTSREAELAGLAAYESPHHPCGGSIGHGLN